MTTEPRVRMQHLRALRYCSRGAREWCARHGLSWYELRHEGLPVSAVEATGDAMAIRAAQLAREEG